MILGFTKVFKVNGKTKPTDFRQKVLEGRKVHTIRADINQRWKPGRKIQFATGARTKYYECFKEGECVSIQEFEVKQMIMVSSQCAYRKSDDRIYSVLVDGNMLTIDKVEVLAKNDGFDSIDEFFSWFTQDPEGFVGRLIHWTDLKY